MSRRGEISLNSGCLGSRSRKENCVQMARLIFLRKRIKRSPKGGEAFKKKIWETVTLPEEGGGFREGGEKKCDRTGAK